MDCSASLAKKRDGGAKAMKPKGVSVAKKRIAAGRACPKITAATITGLALVYVIGIERSIRFASALGLVSVQSANAMRGLLGVTAATRGLAVAESAAIASNTALAASSTATAASATIASAAMVSGAVVPPADGRDCWA